MNSHPTTKTSQGDEPAQLGQTSSKVTIGSSASLLAGVGGISLLQVTQGQLPAEATHTTILQIIITVSTLVTQLVNVFRRKK